MALGHKENYSVASWLLPRSLRPHMYAVYAYCRTVDDLGDEAEGDRLAHLNDWEGELRRCYDGSASGPVFVALQESIREFDIPIEPFLRLIEANRKDQRTSRYGTFDELLEYCSYSANPVGHLVLYLFGYRDAGRQRLADYTCTALQLANFWQDVSADLGKGRTYIPREDMTRFGYGEEELVSGAYNAAFRRLMAFEVSRTRRFFADGLQLLPLVSRRLRFDLRLFTLGGLAALEAVERADYDVLRRRPRVSGRQKLWLGLRSLLPSPIRVGVVR
jgi:squalene synthase HpnC